MTLLTRHYKRVRAGLLVASATAALSWLFFHFAVSLTPDYLVAAQTSCSTPSFLGKQFAWAQGAHVTVNIDPAFSQTQRDAVTAAFTNWQAANGQTGNDSGVTFEFTYNATPPASGTPNSYQVSRQDPAGPAQAVTGGTTNTTTNTRNSAFTNVRTAVTNNEALTQAMTHEVGHTFGLGECSGCPPKSSAMVGLPCCNYNDTSYGVTAPTSCDNSKAKQGSGYNYSAGCYNFEDCPDWDEATCSCSGSSGCTSDADCPCEGTCDLQAGGCFLGGGDCSPIIIAVGKDSNYELTSPQAGVWFDIDGNGVRDRVAWTRAGYEIAFLVLDRNGNGLIDDGTELFGNHTILPSGHRAANGFEALAYYDKPDYGGNGDGTLNSQDLVWFDLRLWIDRNHNGVSERDELSSLAEFDLLAIRLALLTTNRADEYGNVFRYGAQCQVGRAVRIGYDVFFTARPTKRQHP